MKGLFVDAGTELARLKSVARRCHSRCNLGMVFGPVSETASQARHLEPAVVKSQNCLLVAFWTVSPG